MTHIRSFRSQRFHLCFMLFLNNRLPTDKRECTSAAEGLGGGQ
jgi:hypothetical protein